MERLGFDITSHLLLPLSDPLDFGINLQRSYSVDNRASLNINEPIRVPIWRTYCVSISQGWLDCSESNR